MTLNELQKQIQAMIDEGKGEWELKGYYEFPSTINFFTSEMDEGIVYVEMIDEEN